MFSEVLRRFLFFSNLYITNYETYYQAAHSYISLTLKKALNTVYVILAVNILTFFSSKIEAKQENHQKIIFFKEMKAIFILFSV